MNAQSDYTPRPGSKVSLTIQALLDGPMAAEALARVMSSPTNSVNGMLHAPVKRGLLARVQDPAGLLHYALAGMALDEQFSVYQGRDPIEARKPVSPVLWPQAKTNVNPADPFGLVGKQTAPRPVPQEGPRPVPAQQQHVPRIATVKSVPPAPANDEQLFVTTLFSTGELMIKVGAITVMLTRDHQRQLQEYVSRYEKTE